MRLNKYLASATSLSRRKADEAIVAGRVSVNDKPAEQGMDISATDVVSLDGQTVQASDTVVTIMFNKPRGYVVSRYGQGSDTIYDLLPAEYQQLNPVGRLDKDSSGLLLLTNDGQLAQELTHPSHHGITLEDGPSKLQLERQTEGDDTKWLVTMHEGRNRQIRRTFSALGYGVKTLHRTTFGPYRLQGLALGSTAEAQQ
jgi:23S rRNA pseudouridine2605 synthase